MAKKTYNKQKDTALRLEDVLTNCRTLMRSKAGSTMRRATDLHYDAILTESTGKMAKLISHQQKNQEPLIPAFVTPGNKA